MTSEVISEYLIFLGAKTIRMLTCTGEALPLVARAHAPVYPSWVMPLVCSILLKVVIM